MSWRGWCLECADGRRGMTDHLSQSDRWTILVCPKCRKSVPYSATDASHGFLPRCGCTSFLAPDAEGYMAVQGGTEPVPVIVTPENLNWSGEN